MIWLEYLQKTKYPKSIPKLQTFLTRWIFLQLLKFQAGLNTNYCECLFIHIYNLWLSNK